MKEWLSEDWWQAIFYTGMGTAAGVAAHEIPATLPICFLVTLYMALRHRIRIQSSWSEHEEADVNTKYLLYATTLLAALAGGLVAQ